MSSPNLLNAETLLKALSEALPAENRPQLASPQDALAALSHAILASLGFRLINLGESNPVPQQPLERDNAHSRLPQNWNASGPDLYTFGYRHDQSSLEFVVKLVKVAGRILVTASAVEHNRTAVWEVTTADYSSASFYPYPPTSGETTLANGFITLNRVQDFANEFNSHIVRAILPGLTKDGYEQPSTSTNEPSSSRSPERSPRGEPFHPTDTSNPRPPLFHDPDDPSLPGPPYQPFGVGQRDLDPFAANPLPLPGRSIGSFAPPPLFGGGNNGGGGGMFIGPDDPLFRGRFPPAPGTGLPPGAVPPGARFDPIFPGGQRYPQAPARGGPGFPRPPLGGDPDFDDFLPPRNSDYDNMFG